MKLEGFCQLLAAAWSSGLDVGPGSAAQTWLSPACVATPATSPINVEVGKYPDISHEPTRSATDGTAVSPTDGIDFTASYGFEAAANVSGGTDRRVANAGQLVLAASIDAGKSLGLRGGTFQATITYRHGKDLGATGGLGTLQQVQEVFGRGKTWRLTQLWYSQVFAGGAADVKLGRLTQGEDFGDFSCQFMNLTFCGMPAGNLAGDYWYNWPISQWGARLRVRDGRFYAMAGAYEDNPRNLHKTFTIGYFHGATGVLVPIEVGYMARLGASTLPGTYKLGAWYSSSDGNDVRLDANRPQLVHTGSSLRQSRRYGVYLQMQQQLSGTAGDGPDGPATVRGLIVFLNVTQTDRQTSRIDNQVAGGLFYTGLLRARPKDQLGVAAGRTNVNGRARPLAAGSEGTRLDAEYATEIYYDFHVADWLTLRPNVQYVVNPGGNRDATDVVVLGLKGAIVI